MGLKVIGYVHETDLGFVGAVVVEMGIKSWLSCLARCLRFLAAWIVAASGIFPPIIQKTIFLFK